MKFVLQTCLLIVYAAWTLSVISAAPRLSARLSIGGNLSQTNTVSGHNNTGLIGNIVDNSDNNGTIENKGQDNSEAAPPRPVARISIGGNDNSNNVIGVNSGSGNIVDNSENSGTLVNNGQNSNADTGVALVPA